MDRETALDKIRKCLALSTSPNENEARAALLQAQRIMVKFKVSDEEVRDLQGQDRKIVERTTPITFSTVRPKSVKAKKRPDMTVKPDLDKLCRTVLDALTGVAYKDDSQVIGIIANKRYGEVEMLHVKVVSG